jgi:nicotinamidase/pyrazinamidase
MTASTDRYGPRTALVVVDMQNDFVHPDGSLYVHGGARSSPR